MTGDEYFCGWNQNVQEIPTILKYSGGPNTFDIRIRVSVATPEAGCEWSR